MVDEVAPLESQDGAALRDQIRSLQQQVAQLQDELATFTAIVDAVPDMILVKGPESRIVYGNQAFREFYGMSNADLQGLIDAPFNAPDHTKQYVHDDAEVFSTGKPLVIEHEPVTRADGVVRLFKTTKHPVKNAAGEVIRTFGISRDITVQLEDTVAMQHSQQKLAQHFQQMPLAYIEWDRDFRILEWNMTAERIFGYSRAEVIGRAAADLILPPEMQPRNNRRWQALFTQPQSQHITTNSQTKDGRTLLCEWFNTPLLDATGAVVGAASMIQDMTDRVAAAEALRQSEERLRAVVANVPLILYIIDQHGTITLSEGKGLEAMGVRPGQLVGQTVFDVYSDQAETLQHVRRALAGETFSQQTENDNIVSQNWFGPMRDRSGEIKGMFGVSLDITERVKAEQERTTFQERLIAMQANALAELSTPIIQIDDNTIVMPLIGNVDARRSQQIIETLLTGVTTHQARVAIIDITGVAVVDSQVGSALIQAAQATRLLGADVVLTGIRPEVAQTLVAIGVDLTTVITHSNLQSGVAYALRRR